MSNLLKLVRSNTMLEGWRPVIQSGVAGILGKAITAGTRLVSIPLALNYLGQERYGVWILISSISGYILLFDFGISSAIVNQVTKYNADGDNRTASQYILSAFLATSLVAILLILLSVPVIYAINWKEIFKISAHISTIDIANVFLLGTILFLIQLPLSIFLKIPYTFQRGYQAEIFLMIGNVLSFLGIIASVYWNTGMYWLVAFLISPQIIAGVGVGIYLYAKKEIAFVRMSLREIAGILKNLKSIAMDFVTMQVVSSLMVVLQFNILGYYHGAKEVAIYGYMTQIATAIQLPLIILLQPMWTKFVQLIREGKYDHVKGMVKKYHVAVALYSVFIVLFFVMALNYITGIITKEPMQVNLDLRIVFTIQCCLGLAFGGFVSMMTAALNLTRAMMAVNIAQFLLFVGSAYVLVPQLSSVGIVLACLTSYLLAIPFYYFKVRPKLFA